jgi:hypothetical protein
MATDDKNPFRHGRADSASSSNLQKLTSALEKRSGSTANFQALGSVKPANAPSGQPPATPSNPPDAPKPKQ